MEAMPSNESMRLAREIVDELYGGSWQGFSKNSFIEKIADVIDSEFRSLSSVSQEP